MQVDVEGTPLRAKPLVTGATPASQQPGAAAPAVTGAQVAAAAPAAPPANAYDYSTDPILMQAKAFAASANQQAQAQAAARMKQLAIEYNDPNNPFSTVARIDRSYGESLTNTNESYNKQNLWYSGHRAKALSGLGTALQQSKYDAANQYRAQTTDVQNQLASAMLGNQQDVIGAEQGAYERALGQALQYGINPGAQPGTTIAPGATAPDFFAGLADADPNQLAAALKPASVAKPAAAQPALGMRATASAGAGGGVKKKYKPLTVRVS